MLNCMSKKRPVSDETLLRTLLGLIYSFSNSGVANFKHNKIYIQWILYLFRPYLAFDFFGLHVLAVRYLVNFIVNVLLDITWRKENNSMKITLIILYNHIFSPKWLLWTKFHFQRFAPNNYNR